MKLPESDPLSILLELLKAGAQESPVEDALPPPKNEETRRILDDINQRFDRNDKDILQIFHVKCKDLAVPTDQWFVL